MFFRVIDDNDPSTVAVVVCFVVQGRGGIVWYVLPMVWYNENCRARLTSKMIRVLRGSMIPILTYRKRELRKIISSAKRVDLVWYNMFT